MNFIGYLGYLLDFSEQCNLWENLVVFNEHLNDDSNNNYDSDSRPSIAARATAT